MRSIARMVKQTKLAAYMRVSRETAGSVRKYTSMPKRIHKVLIPTKKPLSFDSEICLSTSIRPFLLRTPPAPYLNSESIFSTFSLLLFASCAAYHIPRTHRARTFISSTRAGGTGVPGPSPFSVLLEIESAVSGHSALSVREPISPWPFDSGSSARSSAICARVSVSPESCITFSVDESK
eukprot:3015606-Rhodomonas_salina.3